MAGAPLFIDDLPLITGALAARDPALSAAVDMIGAPHIRLRKGGFEGLFRIIVEQQVSVPSAQAIWGRCRAGLPRISANAVLSVGEDGLKAFGLSGPKARYVFHLAEAVAARRFSFAALKKLSDEDAAAELTSLLGVGPWSAAIYLLFCEGRIDIWPEGDVALLAAYQAAAGLEERPAMAAFNALAQDWAPHRGLAAHILWTYYAHIRVRTPI